MSLPSPTTASLLPGSTAPVDHSHSAWLFPPALNTTYISEYNARLPPGYSTDWGNGTSSYYPPTIFGSHGARPDIILDAIYGLTFEQRVAVPPGVLPKNSFGRADLSVRIGDTITLDWEGGEEKVVAMTCHECFRFDIETQGAFEGCEQFKSSYGELMQFRTGALSTDEQHMKWTFSDTYGYTDWHLPQPKIAPNTPITFPKLSSASSSAVCMFTLDWDPWVVNTKHSVPFPVVWEPHVVGREEYNVPIYDAWAFNSTHPNGVSISGRREMSKDDAGEGGSKNDLDEKKEAPMGTIIASVLGGIAGLVVIFWILNKAMRRSNNRMKEEEDAVQTAQPRNNEPVASLQAEIDAINVAAPPTYAEATKV